MPATTARPTRLLLAVAVAAAVAAEGAAGAVRRYFIQAEAGLWDYGPGGYNRLDNRRFADFQEGLGVSLPRGAYEWVHQPFLWMTPMACADAGRCDTHPGRIGSVYTKARLVAYTDASFTTPVARTNDEVHLGYLGPTLRAAVGDELEVTFRNGIVAGQFAGLDTPAASLHPHGVFYSRTNEGAVYLNNETATTVARDYAVAQAEETDPEQAEARRRAYDSAVAPTEEELVARFLRSLEESDKKKNVEISVEEDSLEDAEPAAGSSAGGGRDQQQHGGHRRAGYHPSTGPGSSILSGETYTYRWSVPARAGPGPNDGSSVAWFYHSHVDEPADTNAVLTGAIIVTDAARADPVTAKPTDVDREIINIYQVTDENSSPFIMHDALVRSNAFRGNVTAFAAEGNQFGGSKNPMFQQSNFMHNVNGRSYGTLEGVYMHQGERVRWYVGSLGAEKDIHGAHWHGNTLLWNQNRVDSIPLIPAVLVAADMTPDNVGVWQFHCHTNHHVHGGMTALYEVLPPLPGYQPPTPPASPTPAASSDGDDASSPAAPDNSGWIVAIIILAVCLVAVCLAAIFFMYNKQQQAKQNAVAAAGLNTSGQTDVDLDATLDDDDDDTPATSTSSD